jgi:hypothetical protein
VAPRIQVFSSLIHDQQANSCSANDVPRQLKDFNTLGQYLHQYDRGFDIGGFILIIKKVTIKVATSTSPANPGNQLMLHLEKPMNKTEQAVISIFFTLLLLSASSCARLSSPGVTSAGSASIKVSTSPLQWQRVRGPYFTNPEEARNYAEQLTLDGYTDWRLPTREEMLDFYYAFDFGSAQASELGINIEGYYWVMDEDGTINAGSWCDGQICEISRSYRASAKGGFVRAVRQ